MDVLELIPIDHHELVHDLLADAYIRNDDTALNRLLRHGHP